MDAFISSSSHAARPPLQQRKVSPKSKSSAPNSNRSGRATSSVTPQLSGNSSHSEPSRVPEQGTFAATGDSESHETWTLLYDVLSALYAQPKSDYGVLYAVQDAESPGYVKIGCTVRDLTVRLKEIQGQHGRKLKIGSAFRTSPMASTKLDQLEKVVHADLAFFQRRLYKPRSKGTSREWFAVDMEVAVKTIMLWNDILTKSDYQQSVENEKAVRTKVLDMPGFKMGHEIHDSDRVEINGNHRWRMQTWRNVFTIKEEIDHFVEVGGGESPLVSSAAKTSLILFVIGTLVLANCLMPSKMLAIGSMVALYVVFRIST